MLRQLILLGIFAAVSVSFPIFYEWNPSAVERWMGEASDSAPSAAPAAQSAPKIAVVAMPESTAETQPLLGRKVLVRANDSGHFVAEFRLNGRKADAMIDTGATTVALNRTMARRIGISLSPADFKYEVRTANGTVKGAAATIDRVQVGRITLERIEALVLEDRALDGVLVGMSFLNRLSKFQVADGALVMQQ